MGRKPIPPELTDAAAVHAAMTQVNRAIGPLAASPLDTKAATSMRAALDRATSPAVRTALQRLQGWRS